jgi:hypothetical protein
MASIHQFIRDSETHTPSCQVPKNLTRVMVDHHIPPCAHAIILWPLKESGGWLCVAIIITWYPLCVHS